MDDRIGLMTNLDASQDSTFLTRGSIKLIDRQPDLNSLVQKLSHCQHLAVDTEANGFFAYYERVCLIQISDGRENYIIDPLSVKDCSPLRLLCENPDIEKIMHDGMNDVSGLKRDFNISVINLFDTAVACRVLGKKRRGLGSLVEEYFGIKLDKKGQQYNWGKRPLESKYLYYAALDVYFLIPLAEKLKTELAARDLLDIAKERSKAVANSLIPARSFPRNGFARIQGYEDLDDDAKAVVRRLYAWRDSLARRWDRAPFRVLPNNTIVLLAQNKPTTCEDLRRIKGLPRVFKKGSLAKTLLKIIWKEEEDKEAK